MNCQRFENVMSELARGQMMAAEQRSEALAHSDTCDDCSARLRNEEMLTRGLRSLALEMESLEAPPEIETTLLAEFRNRSVPAARKRSNSRYWLSAVAAILLLAIAIVAMRSRSTEDGNRTLTRVDAPAPRKDEALPVKSIEKPVDRQDLAADNAADNQKQEASVRHSKPRRRPNSSSRPAAAVAANHVANEIATDFMPLGYMNAASLQEGGQIVRVELRRSALASFGFPVNMERYNEKVKADVLLGVDGLAHAIRFVQ